MEYLKIIKKNPGSKNKIQGYFFHSLSKKQEENKRDK